MTKDAALSLRIPGELKAALERAAAADGRRVGNLAERLLSQAMVKAGYLKPQAKKR